MSGKKYFYAIGQRARSMGWTKVFAEEYYAVDTVNYARIYFDKGYRGLSF